MADHSHGDHKSSRSNAGRWVFWGFILVAAFFLISEHRAHVFEYLPIFLLLGCVLMHFFHRHGGHGRQDKRESDEPKR